MIVSPCVGARAGFAECGEESVDYRPGNRDDLRHRGAWGAGRQGDDMRIELRVSEAGEDILVYNFQTPAEAGEMIHFLSDFFPSARFTVQPLRH